MLCCHTKLSQIPANNLWANRAASFPRWARVGSGSGQTGTLKFTVFGFSAEYYFRASLKLSVVS